jgi:hypothetical protein
VNGLLAFAEGAPLPYGRAMIDGRFPKAQGEGRQHG